jgi:hypothetical protein
MTMPWWRALAAALALAAVVGGVLVAGVAQAQAVTTGTLSISGDSNDSVTGGKSYSYSTSKGDMLGVSSETGGTVSIRLITPGGGGWNLDFDAPGSPDQPVPGHSPVLVPGTYTAARRYPFNGTSPGLSLSGIYGCNEVAGSFTVKKAVFGPQGYVQAFDATFVQHCDGVAAAARGEVRISNPPPSPSPSPPPPSPSPTMANPYATASTYAWPTTATGTDAALAGGRAAGAPPTTAPWTDADRGRFVMIGFAVIAVIIAVVILVATVVIGVRSKRLEQEYLSREPRAAWPGTTGGIVLASWPTDDPVEHRWLPYDPSPPVARRSLPGKVIAAAVVVAGRGMLGVLVTGATIAALQLHPVQQLGLPSWYGNVLWLQLGVCAGEVVFGLLLFLGKLWPRMLALSVLWFDIAAGALIMLTTTPSCGGFIGMAVDAVLLWMLFWPEVRDWCY